MNIRSKTLIVILSLLVFFFGSSDTYAQTDTESLNLIPSLDLLRPSDITVIPEYPRENQDVYIKINNFSANLNASRIQWVENGVVKQNEVGKTSFSTRTGEIGSTKTIDIIITTENGLKISETVVLKPTVIDLVWESNGYTPPFFKGKALYGIEGQIKVIASPHFTQGGAPISANDLVYTWKVDTKVIGDKSGRGKSTLTIDGSPLLRPLNIELLVSHDESGQAGKETITIPQFKTIVQIYEEHPLYGTILSKALSSKYSIKGREISVQAVPYTMSVTDPKSEIVKYTWSLNGKKITISNSPVLTLRAENSDPGLSVVGVTVEHIKKVFQKGDKSVDIRYNTGQNNLFSN